MLFKIADFGTVKLAVSGDDSKLLNTENNIGTRLYMPPEAFKGDCSAKWDVWSFGVVSFLNKGFLIINWNINLLAKYITGAIGNSNRFTAAG